jgi:hypothetical protein
LVPAVTILIDSVQGSPKGFELYSDDVPVGRTSDSRIALLFQHLNLDAQFLPDSIKLGLKPFDMSREDKRHVGDRIKDRAQTGLPH